jgi:hexosaminidase
MQRLLSLLLLNLLVAASFAQNTYSLIPFPARFAEKPGQFTFSKDTKIVLAATDPTAKQVVQNLATMLSTASGAPLGVVNASPAVAKGAHVFFTLLKDSPWGYEGYQLKISPERISIESESTKGLFYATQTLLQLMPNEILSGQKIEAPNLKVPACDIQDRPRFAYRGLHLDVARHFYPVSFIKKYINLMAMHKMNYFHWHLTDDQGWRIEIKKYPKLTQVGAKRKETSLGHYDENFPMKFDGKAYGGYYTQEEIKDIVRYAQARFISIIPEIEMPGHASAALAAYPEYGCGTEPYQVKTQWGVFEDIFCPTDKTFKFLEEVLTEVFALFPGKYIHIGGDECPKEAWKESKVCQDIIKKNKLKDEAELQSFFIKRMEKFVNAKGKVLVGWDEILEGGLAPNATVMSWRGTQGSIEAAKLNHDVIMTPTDFCYFDYYQTNPDHEPIAAGGYLPLEKVYNYEPVPSDLTEAQAKRILGAQGNVWSEYLQLPEDVEYMAFPRATALAEVLWAQPGTRNFEDFLVRLKSHQKRLDALKVNYAKVLTDVQVKSTFNAQRQLEVRLDATDSDTKIFYTLDGKEPTSSKANEYVKPILIAKSATLKTISMPNGRKSEQKYVLHKGFSKKYTFVTPPVDNPNNEKLLTDGMQKSSPKNRDGWVGFYGNDMEVLIDLTESETVKKVSMNFLKIIADNGFPPIAVEVAVSKDGKEFKDVVTLPVSYDLNGPWKAEPIEVNLKSARGRFVRVKAKSAGVCPPNHPNVGEKTWMAIDEIVIE